VQRCSLLSAVQWLEPATRNSFAYQSSSPPVTTAKKQAPSAGARGRAPTADCAGARLLRGRVDLICVNTTDVSPSGGPRSTRPARAGRGTSGRVQTDAPCSYASPWPSPWTKSPAKRLQTLPVSFNILTPGSTAICYPLETDNHDSTKIWLHGHLYVNWVLISTVVWPQRLLWHDMGTQLNSVLTCAKFSAILGQASTIFWMTRFLLGH